MQAVGGRAERPRFPPVVALLAALLSCGWILPPGVEQASFKDHMLRAQLLLDSHEAEQALEPLANALELQPTSEQALALMALAHLQLGRLREGRIYVQALVRQAPKKARHRLLLAAFDERLNQPDEALAEYRRALDLDAHNEPAWSQLQRFSASLPIAPARLEVFKAIAREHPKAPKAHLALGITYWKMGRPLDAVESFQQSLHLKESVDAHHQLGIVYAEMRVFEKALGHFNWTLELQPGHLPSLYAKGMLYSRHQEPEKALEMYRQVLERDPRHALVRFRIGEVQESEARLEEAEAAYRGALEADPRLQPARFRLGRLLLEQGRLQQAREELSAAVRLDPRHAEAHLALARVLDALEQPEAAEAHFKAALEADPLLTNAYLSYGNFLMRRSRQAEARRLLQRFAELKAFDDKSRERISAVDFRPNDDEAWRGLIEHLLSGGRLGLALKSAYRLVLSAPEDPLGYELLAKVYEAAGRMDDAASALERAHRSPRPP